MLPVTQKRKLLFVSNLFPDTAEPYRGLDNARLLAELSAEFDIRVIALRPGLPFLPGSPRNCREEDHLFSPFYLKAPYIPKLGSRFNHILMSNALSPAIQEVQRNFPFEVVLVSWVYPDGCAVSRLSTSLHFPFVVVAQGSDVHQYLNIPARRKIICRSMEGASVIITRSAELGRLLAGAGVAREKLHTVYNGIDFDLFMPRDPGEARKGLGLPLDERIILFVGNFLPVKNPLLLVKAHAGFCRMSTSPKCRLVMIGGGPMESEIRALAKAEGFERMVLVAGRKNSGEIAQFMQAADLLCLPSENEGVPNVILEAFAAGLRVVASRVGGIPEVLSEDMLGILVEQGNEQELQAAFAKIFSQPAQTANIRQHALQFSWERTTAQYAALLKR